MANAAAKIQEEELEVFFNRYCSTQYGDQWFVQYFAVVYDEFVYHPVMDTSELMSFVRGYRRAITSDRTEDFIYVLGPDFDLDDFSSISDLADIEEVDSNELERFIIDHNVGESFLRFCPSNESFESGNYMTLSHLSLIHI